jgi:hypothetical protein
MKDLEPVIVNLTDALLHSQAQFLIICIHSFSLLFMDETCAYPKIFGPIFGTLAAIMFLLFLEFYVKAYVKKTS